MSTLNLGILAHVDAGKTSLTERLLFAAGVIDQIGSVDDGSTQTDSLALERQRGITIKSAVVSFVVGDVTVNLIDTPGHPDFIAEVERVLSVLDGAVLVISAVEGVQAQTRVLMRALQRLRIPTLIFVNKIDRRGAQYETVLRAIGEKLTSAIIPMGSVEALGGRAARQTPFDPIDAEFNTRLVDLLADHDDAFLAAYVHDETAVSRRRLRTELAAQTGRALVHPVFFGSAITGAGVDSLLDGITELLPAADGDVDGPVSGTVFKVERGPAGEKVAYVRMFSGTVRTRDRLPFRCGEEGKVTAIDVFDRGSAVRSPAVTAGQIGKLWGLGDIQIGDPIGVPRTTLAARHQFSPPTLETVVVPSRACRQGCAARGAHPARRAGPADQPPAGRVPAGDLRVALRRGAEGGHPGDAGGRVRRGRHRSARRRRSASSGRVGTGAAVEIIGTESNPFLATIGLRIEPAPIGAGVRFRLEIELGSLPLGVPQGDRGDRARRRCDRASTAGRSPTARSR